MPLIQERAKNTSEERIFYTARVHARKPDTQVMQTDNVTESLKEGQKQPTLLWKVMRFGSNFLLLCLSSQQM